MTRAAHLRATDPRSTDLRPTDLDAATHLAEQWVCLAWDGHVLPGVWPSEPEALLQKDLERYGDEVARVSQVRDLPTQRQADVSRSYGQASVRSGGDTWSR